MPSRKSEVRQSDVSSVSRSAAGDEDSPMAMAAPPQQDTVAAASGSLGQPELLSSETPSVPAAESNAGTSEKGKEKDKDRDRDAITIEDLNLPKSIITRLAKGVLPPNTQIQANAILALSKSATVFINHLANAANEWTTSGGKKTIMPADVFRALDDIEYGFMREKLEAEFAKFNDIQSSKRSAYRKKVSAAKKAAQTPGGGSVADSSVLSTGTTGVGEDSFLAANTTGGTTADGGGGAARAAKKARLDASSGTAAEKMDVDGEGEVSDAETVPDEHVEEEEDDDEDEEEEEEEEDDEDEGGPGGEDDELEERPGREMEDEALDEDSE